MFDVKHAGCPAVGYIVGSRHPPSLRDEFKGKTSNEIRELVASGVPIKTDPLDVLELAYTGDTSVEGLMIPTNDNDAELNNNNNNNNNNANNPYLSQVFSCRTLITEATFLERTEQSRDLALLRGHMQVSDVVSALNDHDWRGQDILLIHLSARYNATAALDLILAALPEEVMKKCWVAISSLRTSSSKEEKEPVFRDLIQPNGCIHLYEYAQLLNTLKEDS